MTLDSYSLQIVSKYLNTTNDYINLIHTHKKCQYILDNYKFNPISLNESNVKLFPNIEEYHMYSIKPKSDLNFLKELYNKKALPVINWVNTKYSKQRPNNIHKRVILDKPLNEIPDDMNIAQINARCYSECNVESLVIPTSITKIQTDAFYKCFSLKDVYIPDNVLSLGSFFQCTNLSHVRLPNNITVIPRACFYNCSKLMDVEIPESVTKLEDQCFQSCFSDSAFNTYQLIIPKNVKYIGWSAFAHCDKLNKIILPDNPDLEIYGDAFSDCSSLFEMDLSKINIKVLKDSMFSECVNLKSIKLPTTLEIIEYESFNGCHSLSNITIGDDKSFDSLENLKEIRQYSFSGCDSLTKINLPTSLIILGRGCFNECTNLCEIDLSKLKLKELESFAFKSCSALTNVIFPTYLTKINSSCFEYCELLPEINLPANIQMIDRNCFSHCEHLSKITIGDRIVAGFDEIEILPQRISSNQQIPAFKFSSPKNIIINSGAFKNCKSLKNISLKGILSLSDGCFQDCSNLTKVILDDNIKEIFDNCFRDCSNLQEINLSPRLKCIGLNVFHGCEKLSPQIHDIISNIEKEYDERLKRMLEQKKNEQKQIYIIYYINK